jgi:hypothetical protein
MADEETNKPVDNTAVDASSNQEASEGWSFEPEDNGSDPGSSQVEKLEEVEQSQSQEVSWQASEYISHQRGVGWYVGFVSVVLLISAAIIYWQRDIFSVVVLLLLSGGLLYFINAKPNNRTYIIDDEGISIGEVLLPFESFRSFSIQVERGLYLLTFRPLKRFGLPTEAYMTKAEVDPAVEILQRHLPLEEREMNFIDKTINQLHL